MLKSCPRALNSRIWCPILSQVGEVFGLFVEQRMSPKHNLLRGGTLLLLPIALAIVLCLVTGCGDVQRPPDATELFLGMAISFG